MNNFLSYLGFFNRGKMIDKEDKKMVEILVRGFDGKIFMIKISNDNTIDQLKGLIEEKIKIPKSQQQLYINFFLLDNSMLISLIPKDSILNLTSKLKGGAHCSCKNAKQFHECYNCQCKNIHFYF